MLSLWVEWFLLLFFLWIIRECVGSLLPVSLYCSTGNGCCFGAWDTVVSGSREVRKGWSVGSTGDVCRGEGQLLQHEGCYYGIVFRGSKRKEAIYRQSTWFSGCISLWLNKRCLLELGTRIQRWIGERTLESDGLCDLQEKWAGRKGGCSWWSASVLETRLKYFFLYNHNFWELLHLFSWGINHTISFIAHYFCLLFIEPSSFPLCDNNRADLYLFVPSGPFSLIISLSTSVSSEVVVSMLRG